MTTDSERREVARMLRELPDDSTYPDLIGVIADHDGWYPAADAADRLADLIEPPALCPHYMYPCCRTDAGGDYIDRDALLALADEMKRDAGRVDELQLGIYGTCYLSGIARRIREALGVQDA